MKFMEKRKDRTYFYTLLTRMISIVFISLLVMSISFYFSFKSLTLDYVYKSHLNALINVRSNVNQITGYVKTLAVSLFNSTDIKRLMYDPKPRITYELESIRNIENVLNSTPFLQSIEISNPAAEGAYYIGTKYQVISTEDDLFDRDFVLLAHKEGLNISTPIARRIPVSYYTDEKADVLSYFVSESVGGDKGIKRTLAVNVNIGWIFNDWENDADGIYTGETYLLDKADMVVASSRRSTFLEDFSSRDFIRTIKEREEENGFFISGKGSEKALVTYTRMEDEGYLLINAIPYRYIAQSVLRLKGMTFVISFMVIVLGILISFALSKKLYSPVNSLLGKAAQLFRGSKGSNNEFDYIGSSIATAAEKINRLQYFERQSLELSKQDFLKSLLSHEADRETAGDAVRRYGLSMDPSGDILVIMFKIDRYRSFAHVNGEKDRDVLKYGFCNLIKEMLCEKSQCEVFDVREDTLAAIVSAKGDEDTACSVVLPLVDEALKLIRKYFNVSLSALLSPMGSGVEAIVGLNKTLAGAGAFRMIYGHGCVKTAKDLKERNAVGQDILDLNIQAVLDALKLGSLDKLFAAYEAVEEKLYKAELANIPVSISYLASMVFNTAALIEKNGNISLEADYPAFSETLAGLETLEEVKEAYFQLFRYIVERLTCFRSNRSLSVYHSVMNYISRHYLSADINTNALSRAFNLTPAYLNRIFKEQHAVSIPEYLARLKIDKACDYLKNTGLSVEDIIKKVGWDNKNYFFTVFKKHTGVTPTEYRQRERTL